MTRQHSILLVIAVSAVAAVAGWMMLVKPKNKDAEALAGKVTEVQQALTSANAQIAQYQQARDTYQANYVAVTRLGKAVPAGDDVRSLMVQVEAAAKKAKVDFRTIELATNSSPAAPAGGGASQYAAVNLPPGSSIGPAGFPTMPFGFSFRGSFFELSDFFARLEKFVTVSNKKVDVTGRLLHLDAIKLFVDPALGFPHIRASVAATSYIVPPTEGLLNGATPQGPGVPATDRSAQPPLPGAAVPASAGAATPANPNGGTGGTNGGSSGGPATPTGGAAITTTGGTK